MNKKVFVIGAMGLSLAITSCVDDNYDMSDVDWTLGVNTDLTLPTSSTGDILLKNILNLKEEGVVKLVSDPANPGNDYYVVTQSGTANVPPVKINAINIAKPVMADINTTINIRSVITPAPSHRKISLQYGSYPAVTIADKAYCYDIQDGQAKQAITGAVATGISADVVSLEKVKFDDTKATFVLTTSGFPAHIPTIHIDNFQLKLPADLHVKSCKLDGVDAVDIQPGLIKLTGNNDIARSTSGLTIELVFDEAKTGSNFLFDGDNHTASLTGDLEFKGTFRVQTDEMDEAGINAIINSQTLTTEQLADLANLDLSTVPSVIPASVTFIGKTTIDRDIHLTHVTGKMKHEVTGIKPLALTDLPAFLDNEDCVLDLENPMVFLTIQNTLPADITTKLTLKSETDGYTPRSTGNLVIQGNKTNLYYLAGKEETNYLPAELSAAQYQQVDGLPNLIKRIPNAIDVEVATVTLDATDLDIRQEYPLNIKYDVYAPLVFGEAFKLVYSGVERDWDLGDDLEKLNADKIILTGKVTSSMPSAFVLEMDLLNTNGEKITIVEDNLISVDANAVDAPISITIKAKQGHELKEIFSGANQLDGIRYRATMKNATPGQPLQDQTKITIKDIKVQLKGVFSYDAN